MENANQRTLDALLDLLNNERNERVQAIVWQDNTLDRLVKTAKHAKPGSAESYPSLPAYSAAMEEYARAVASAWERYCSLLWQYLAPQFAELEKVFAQVTDQQGTSVRVRFDSAFGAMYDRAVGIMNFLSHVELKTADPVAVRAKVAPAWEAVKQLRARSEQLDRDGGLKPTVALAGKPSLVEHLEKLDALGSVEVIARMSQDVLAKRLGDAAIAELVYVALLPKKDKEEYLRAKRAAAPAASAQDVASDSVSPKPEEIIVAAFVMPLTIEEIVAAGNPYVFPSPNGTDAYAWKHGAEAEKVGSRVSDFATKSAAQLRKMKVPEPAIALIQATWEKPVDAKKLARALAEKERAEKDEEPRKRKSKD